MDKIIIVGAGGFGHEVREYVQDCLDTEAVKGEFVGFLDDTYCSPSHTLKGEPVLGSILDHVVDSKYSYIIAIGDPKVRGKIFLSLKEKGAIFLSIIHPSSYISSSALIGEGVIGCPFSFVGAHSVVEANCALNIYSSVGHDCTVGMSSVLSPYATLNGGVKLGTEIFLGTSAVVTKGFTIGRCTKIAAGSIVYNDLGEKAEAFGNPARVKK